jgi:hypothetical protein
MDYVPDGQSLYWGDFHKHMTDPRTDSLERLDEIIEYASYHLDVFNVMCYPFKWQRRGENGGILEETVGGEPEFEEWWERIQAAAERNLSENFVTFPGYEWHGDRTRWGDHTVVYFEEGYPLDDESDLPDLYENMRERRAFVIPHHTAYLLGQRAKDWDAFDPELSPVMELYSNQGSSEAVDSPVPMDTFRILGPRTSGGTFVDGLDRGHRVGVIGSNDQPGLPGTWGKGVTGIWAKDLTREAVWEAIRERRTYAVTGDRIRLWFEVDGTPMGSVVDSASDTLEATVAVDCPQALDRIELIHDGRVLRTYTHQGNWVQNGSDVYRMLVEVGWGPGTDHPLYETFGDVELEWRGEVRTTDGRITAVQPRFTGLGNRYELDDGVCKFEVTTAQHEDWFAHFKQGLIVEFKAPTDADVVVETEDREFSISVDDALERGHLFPFLDESKDRIEREFGLAPDEIWNRDVFYHNARKLNVLPAYPKAACAASVTFEDLPAGDRTDYYYVRASQIDGQYAWSSPIWVP